MYKHRNEKNAQNAQVASGAPGAGSVNAQQARESQASESQGRIMQLPLFPLKNVVLFPGMVLPLHIFEMRYREMINQCIEEQSPFGVVLISEGEEVGRPAVPYTVGTAARITRTERLDDGRMNITAVGTQRFRVLELDAQSQNYLVATVRPLPFINGSTQLAADLAHKVRPRIFEYIELLSEATKQELKLDRLPEDPTTLAMLVGIAMQVASEDKQKLLERVGIPQMLSWSLHLLSREILFARHMVETQDDIMQMNSGPTGYIFPN
jgi:Lon protease-like protein